jgi:hypothetical protein
MAWCGERGKGDEGERVRMPARTGKFDAVQYGILEAATITPTNHRYGRCHTINVRAKASPGH